MMPEMSVFLKLTQVKSQEDFNFSYCESFRSYNILPSLLHIIKLRNADTVKPSNKISSSMSVTFCIKDVLGSCEASASFII
jgi:hypothetical protein